MTSYFLRRLLLVPVTFVAITMLVYTVLRYVPGGPIEEAEVQMRLGGTTEGGAGGGGSATSDASSQVPVAELKNLQRYYQLDSPVLVGYLQWLGVWPREIATSVPPVSKRLHAGEKARLEQATKAVAAARAAVEKAIADRELVYYAGRVWHRVLASEVDPEVRKRAEELAARTFGRHFALEDYLADYHLAFDDGRYLAPAKVTPAIGSALEALAAARTGLEKAEADTGYVLRPDGSLLQREFAALAGLKARELEVRDRLDGILVERGYVAFRGRIYRPITKEERQARAEFFRDMDELKKGGYGDRDKLIEALAAEGFTYANGKYFRPVAKETIAKDPAYFATARALIAAKQAAIAKLADIRDRHGYEVSEDLRIQKVESKLSGILELDFGTSFQFTAPVLSVIGSRIGISVQFGLTGYLLGWIICVPLGVMKAIRHRTGFDTGTSVLVFLGYSIPGFVLAIVLLSTVAVHVSWIPLGGYKPPNIDQLSWFASVWGRIRYMAIPVAGYMVGGFATMTILMKNSLLENLGQDYVRTAFAKGLTERRVIFVHALRNSLIPITAGIGQALGLLFAGSFLIEKACNIPGMGLLGYNAILSRDFPIILGLLVFLVLIRLIGNIISDLIWALIDPRIRFG